MEKVYAKLIKCIKDVLNWVGIITALWNVNYSWIPLGIFFNFILTVFGFTRFCYSSWSGSHLCIQNFIKEHFHISCSWNSRQRWGYWSLALTLMLARDSWCIWTELSWGRIASSSKTRPVLIPDESPSQVSALDQIRRSHSVVVFYYCRHGSGWRLSGVQKNNSKLQKDCS